MFDEISRETFERNNADENKTFDEIFRETLERNNADGNKTFDEIFRETLKRKSGIEMEANIQFEGKMIYMENEVKVATVKSIVTHANNEVLFGDSKAKVGDIVLTRKGKMKSFGSYDIGRVESIRKTDQVRRGISKITDIVTDASEDFKVLSNELRKKAIKAEIEERMKQVDERQRMQMYAEEDDNIKELLALLDNL